jgi:hypothetical protein
MSTAADSPAARPGDIREAEEQRRAAVIGSLEQLSPILAGHGGTPISVQAEGMETR